MRGARGFGDIAVHQLCNQNDGICYSPNPFTNMLAFANSVAGYLGGDHGYAINPLADRGAADTVIPQAPKIQYGPDLPVPAPTPYEALNGKLPAGEIRQVVAAIADAVYGILPATQQGKATEFWPLAGVSKSTADPATARQLAAQNSAR
ncbi:hypothetical protein EV643_1523 [Kribbella sp. VKM Ac-2527]|uniref:Uncharacterized protein n=1 Tax=Kribbella caucasensis TaxID=2512215 RepID=A0A4R6IYB3_9ACTN|nr:hypothetical protein [Kribbella sp. VKM Ac-2527]TDO27809.1 hypothetical protein EV643_1523 [Kribbella sp. VKM Ac-2527]